MPVTGVQTCALPIFHHLQLPNLLRNFDRLSMAHGVESRMPFMDWRLVTYGFALPETSKIGGGYTKRILRDAMKTTMPEPIRTRKPKIGFTSPMPDWFNGPMNTWLLNEVNTPAFLDQPTWDGPAIRDYVTQRHNQKSWNLGACERVWPILQAHLWRQTFFAPTAHTA